MTRFLFDEQLAEDLCEAVAEIFPGSLHVRLLGHGGAADLTVWDLARAHSCLLVSKDFHRLALLRGAPPKFIWVRLGNCTTEDLADLLRRHQDDIFRFDEREETTILELG